MTLLFETHGLNHITLFVKDLQRSLRFYTETLRMRVVHAGEGYAYLESGTTWFCLSEQPLPDDAPATNGVHHIALTVSRNDFEAAVEHLRCHQVPIVREPVLRGIGQSVNFLDPDGVQWEFHCSNLAERMTVIEEMERKDTK